MPDKLYRYVPLPKPADLAETNIWYANAISDSGLVTGHCLVPGVEGAMRSVATTWIQGLPLIAARNTVGSSSAWATSSDGRCGGLLVDNQGRTRPCIFDTGLDPIIMGVDGVVELGSVHVIDQLDFFGEIDVDGKTEAVWWKGYKAGAERLNTYDESGSSVVAAFRADPYQVYTLLLLEQDGSGQQRSIVRKVGTQDDFDIVDPGCPHHVHAISMNRALVLCGKTVIENPENPNDRSDFAHVWRKIREDGQSMEWARKSLHDQAGCFGTFGTANFVADDGLGESCEGIGHVVGSMANDKDFPDMKGFVFRNDRIHRLDDVCDGVPSGTSIIDAAAVNKYGWIVAKAHRSADDLSVTQACLLVPMDQL